MIAGSVDEKDIEDCETVPELDLNYQKALVKEGDDRLEDLEALKERAKELLEKAVEDEEAKGDIDDAMAAQFTDRRNTFIMASLKYANAYITFKKEEDIDEEIDEELIDECSDLYNNFELVNRDIDKEFREHEEEKKEDQEIENSRNRN